jgi:hypothetical protein
MTTRLRSRIGVLSEKILSIAIGMPPRTLNWRQLSVALPLVVAGACIPKPPEHDLKVSNAWVMDLAIQVSVEPLAPQEQRTTLGIVRVGETKTFADALPQQDRHAIHARYASNRLEFDTSA